MSIYSIQPATFGSLRTYPLASRKSKVTAKDLGRRFTGNTSIATFLRTLPNILAARDLQELVHRIRLARKRKSAILWGMGGHFIKVGLAPILVELMEKGFVSAVAMNGAALIHDFEIAMAGSTSEDVDVSLGKGQFGMAKETGWGINEIAKLAHRIRIGYGEAAGQYLTSGIVEPKNPDLSILIAAYKRRIPVTVHIAIGTDIPHIHPAADGAALGAASYHDFRLFCALVQQMDGGGAYLNWGSAVLLPEIFLKAVSVARNLGNPLQAITTANFDFIQHYRPTTNVLKRPISASNQTRRETSRGFAITGHHELLFPLFAAALLAPATTRRKQPNR